MKILGTVINVHKVRELLYKHGCDLGNYDNRCIKKIKVCHALGQGPEIKGPDGGTERRQTPRSQRQRGWGIHGLGMILRVSRKEGELKGNRKNREIRNKCPEGQKKIRGKKIKGWQKNKKIMGVQILFSGYR